MGLSENVFKDFGPYRCQYFDFCWLDSKGRREAKINQKRCLKETVNNAMIFLHKDTARCDLLVPGGASFWSIWCFVRVSFGVCGLSYFWVGVGRRVEGGLLLLLQIRQIRH